MQMPTFFYYFHCYFWTDIVELTVIVICLYNFLQWMARDTSKNMLLWFYSYTILLLTSYALGCFTLSFLFFFFAPAGAMFLLIIHQETLQKKFIPFKKITPAMVVAQNTWIDNVIQICLYARTRQKAVSFIIEKTNPLEGMLEKKLLIQSPFDVALLKLVIDSSRYDAATAIMVTHTGMLVALATTFSRTSENQQDDIAEKNMPLWVAQAASRSLHTDALFIHSTPSNDICYTIFQGSIVELSTLQTHNFIKRYITSSSSAKKGDSFHDDTTHHESSPYKQPYS
jgi:DNA integrity scanning protein DisA with diadenylate cyclase activity